MTESPTPTSDELIETLRLAQRLGFFGKGDLLPAIEHARHFAASIPADTGRVTDLGSGGGLPALVIAHDLHAVHVMLAERRMARSDFLQRAVRRLGFEDRVTVLAGDIREVLEHTDHRGRSDVVTARSFGEPVHVVEVAGRLLREGGLLVVSDPPGLTAHQRWTALPLEDLGFAFSHSDGTVSVLARLPSTAQFCRSGECFT